MSGGAPPPPAYGQYPGYAPQPQTDGNAVAALILSIVSWVVCPVVPAVIALVLASRAEAAISASGGWRTGSGLVTAARIVSWINIGVVVLALAVGLVAIVIAAVASS